MINPRSKTEIERVKDILDLKVKVAVAANDHVSYLKWYHMRQGLSWTLGYSESDLDVL